MKNGKEHYWAVHSWLRLHPKQGCCSECGGKGKTDWANKSGNYLRDIADYVELCRSCHMQYDGKAKLTPKDIRQIRKDYKPGVFGYIRLANKYGVSKMTTYNIIKRKKWSSVR